MFSGAGPLAYYDSVINGRAAAAYAALAGSNRAIGADVGAVEVQSKSRYTLSDERRMQLGPAYGDQGARVDRQGCHRHAKQDEEAQSGGGERTAGLPEALSPGGGSVHQRLHHFSFMLSQST